MIPITAVGYAIRILELVPLALKGIADAREAVNDGTIAVKAMVASGRNPTQAEWNALNMQVDQLLGLLDTAANARRAELLAAANGDA